MIMNVLAINPGHNGSVALVSDGKLVLYIEEERLSKVKYDGAPFLSILESFNYLRSLDAVVYCGADPKPPVLSWSNEEPCLSLIRKHFPNVQTFYFNMDHHYGHALSGFLNSGFESCVSIVVDGSGSFHQIKANEHQSFSGYEVESVFHFKSLEENGVLIKNYGGNSGNPISFIDNRNNCLINFDDTLSITKMYEAVTNFLGFHFIEAGKIMGLSSYGYYDDQFDKLFLFGRGNKNFFVNQYPAGGLIDPIKSNFHCDNTFSWHKNKDSITNFEKNLAFAIQSKTQELVGDLVEKSIDISGEKNVALSGGYGLNCVSNYYLKKRFPNINFFIDPISHDGGSCIGYAKFVYYKLVSDNSNVSKIDFDKIDIKNSKLGVTSLDSLYLGPDRKNEIMVLISSNHEISTTIENKKIVFDKIFVDYDDVAKLINDGEIVSIFQSRSEGGPRALGNRSILFDPRVKDGKDIVNKVKGREWFRPFAGSVLKEHAHEWFDMAGLEESPFMMYAVDVLSSKSGEIPAITHVDNTCRIQTVTEEQNFHFYNLINSFFKLTSCPILFNTSFNLAGMPLVETVNDAIQTLIESELNYLYFPEANVLLKKNVKDLEHPIDSKDTMEENLQIVQD